MPIASKKDLIERLLKYTYRDDFIDDFISDNFEKIFGISESELDEIYAKKHNHIFIHIDNPQVKCYIDFEELKQCIKQFVENAYKN